MGSRTILGVAAALLLPLSLVAQAPGGGRSGGFAAARLLLDQGSAEFLASKAAELTLTDRQEVQLTELATKFKDATNSERERLAAILPAGPPPGRARRWWRTGRRWPWTRRVPRGPAAA